jgi:phosphatidylinositol alpha-1,6-mannosyltransferase
LRIVLLATDAYGGHGGIAQYNRDLVDALIPHHEVVVIPRIIPQRPQGVPTAVIFRQDAARSAVAHTAVVLSERRRRPDLVICGHVNLLPSACALSAHPLLMIFGIEAWRPLESALWKWALHRCRGAVSISDLTRRRFTAWSGFQGPVELLPNAVRLDRYGVRPKRSDLVERFGLRGKRVLLTVGRLAGAERYKGFDEVMEVLAGLPDDVV